MKYKILSILTVLIFSTLAQSCSSLGSFPLILDSLKNDSGRQGFAIEFNQEIQKFFVEGYTVVFYPKEARIVITRDDSVKESESTRKAH
ncbi:MAG: hypothetical protein ABIG42_10125 [bacterium]